MILLLTVDSRIEQIEGGAGMAVKDFMTSKVIYVSPDTTVAHASDKMKAQDLRRLPVENDRLVGLVTEGTMADATPSKATSLSI